MEAIEGIGGLIFGFSLTRFLSDPTGSIQSRIPLVKISILEILPSLRINLKKTVVHIHHWIFLSIILGFLLVKTASFNQLLLLKGLCFGGIIQGFTFKDRFKIFY